MPNIIIAIGSNCGRFPSIDALVGYYIRKGFSDNIQNALREAVQYNVFYRDFLRDNGYPALVERLKAESVYLDQNPQEFKALDEWWNKLEQNGGLGNYDIQCYGINDSFELLGETINGLDGLKEIVQISKMDRHVSEDTELYVRDTGETADNREDATSSLFAAELYEGYCHESYDIPEGKRVYYYHVVDRCFYIRKYPMTEFFFKYFKKGGIYQSVAENRNLFDLPLAYHNGESPVIYVLSHRQIDAYKIISSGVFEEAMRRTDAATSNHTNFEFFPAMHLNCQMKTFLCELKPAFCDAVLKAKPMTDAGVLYEMFCESVKELPELAIRKWCGNSFAAFAYYNYNRSKQDINRWLQEQVLYKLRDKIRLFKSLPELVDEWGEKNFSKNVNRLLSKYRGTFEEKYSSWPAAIITDTNENMWYKFYSMLEEAREWINSDTDKRETKQFETGMLRNAVMVDIVALDFRWYNGKFSMDCVAKDFYTGMQCRTGLVCGSVEDVKTFLFSRHIIPILLFKGLRENL